MRMDEMREKLAADYEQMSAMMFGTPPKFKNVMVGIEELGNLINDQQSNARR